MIVMGLAGHVEVWACTEAGASAAARPDTANTRLVRRRRAGVCRLIVVSRLWVRVSMGRTLSAGPTPINQPGSATVTYAGTIASSAAPGVAGGLRLDLCRVAAAGGQQRQQVRIAL